MTLYYQTILYAVLSLGLLCTRGPIIASQSSILAAAELFIVLLVLAFFFKEWIFQHKRFDISSVPIYWTLLITYILLISINSLVHFFSLCFLPADLMINMQGQTAGLWSIKTISLAITYVLFPLFVFAQYLMLRKVLIRDGIRILAISFFLSLIFLVYQHVFDPRVLNPWAFGVRVNGFASDPNAMALSLALMIPMLIAGYLLDNNKLFRVFYIVCLLLISITVWWTGSRTGSVGVMLFFLSLPALIAFANPAWSGAKRAVLLVSPILLLTMFALLITLYGDQMRQLGVAASRLVNSWHNFSENGIEGLFWSGDARGEFVRLAWPLLLASPLSGSGPGAFYREYSNLVYQVSDTIKPVLDSVADHYLMLATDFGLPVLIVNIILIILPVWLGIRTLPRIAEVKFRLIVLTLVCSELLFCLMILTVPPSYFLDVVWIWAAQLAILILIAQKYGEFVLWKMPLSNKSMVVLFLLCVVVIFGSISSAFGEKGFGNRIKSGWWNGKFERNCYPPVKQAGGTFRECGANSVLAMPIEWRHVPVDAPRPKNVLIMIKATNPDITIYPLNVTLTTSPGVSTSVSLIDHHWREISVPLAEAGGEYRKVVNDKAWRYAILSINASRTWKDDQGREIGVAVALQSISKGHRVRK